MQDRGKEQETMNPRMHHHAGHRAIETTFYTNGTITGDAIDGDGTHLAARHSGNSRGFIALL